MNWFSLSKMSSYLFKSDVRTNGNIFMKRYVVFNSDIYLVGQCLIILRRFLSSKFTSLCELSSSAVNKADCVVLKFSSQIFSASTCYPAKRSHFVQDLQGIALGCDLRLRFKLSNTKEFLSLKNLITPTSSLVMYEAPSDVKTTTLLMSIFYFFNILNISSDTLTPVQFSISSYATTKFSALLSYTL